MGKELIEKLKNDYKQSVTNKDNIRKNLIQMIRSNIQNHIRDNKLTEDIISKEDVLTIINKELKQQKDSLEAFENGNREDLVKETKEKIAIIEEYLPKQLTEQEIKEIVEKAIQTLGVTELTNKDKGALMKLVMPQVKGKADGKLVNQVVTNFIQ